MENDLKLWFYYSEESPSGLCWAKQKLVGKNLNIIRAKPGDTAGSKNKRGWNVCLDGTMWKAHHIIWYLHTGKLPELIDHIDGNPFNNRYDNLRDVSQAINCRNTSKSALNTSGYTGVAIHLDKYWKASWYENRKLKSKYFSIAVFGNDKAKELAIQFRIETITRLNSLGYGYTERHGK